MFWVYLRFEQMIPVRSFYAKDGPAVQHIKMATPQNYVRQTLGHGFTRHLYEVIRIDLKGHMH